jgi:hypothetical protein
MLLALRKSLNSLTPVALALVIAQPVWLRADDHVVKPAELRQAIQAAADAHRQDRDAVRNLFDSADGRRTLAAAGFDAGKVVDAVGVLDDAALHRLAEKARDARRDFEAGALTNQQITYILIALATAVIILVIVAA